MSSKVGHIIKAVAPLAIAAFAPELAPALGITSALGTAGLGAGLGAGAGLAGGGGIKGALTGALAGGLGAGGGDILAGDAGLTGAGASALSKGLTGAATGFNGTGTLAGTLVGGGIGGVGGYLSGGGLDQIENGLGGDGAAVTADNAPTLGGAASGSPVFNANNSATNLTGINGVGGSAPIGGGGASSFGSSGITGVTGAGANAANDASSIGSSFTKNAGNSLATLLSGGANAYAQNKATDQLVKSQQQSQAELAPFLQNGTNASNALGDYLGTSGNTGAANYGAGTAAFNPSDLTNDPGYQFNLSQGMNALNNSEAAAGGLQSGAAIKAAQQFAQGLAGTTFNNAFNRDLQTKQNTISALTGATTPGLTAGLGTADVNNNIGTAESKGTTGTINTVTSTLASLLAGGGTKAIIGYKSDGTPIYSS